MVNGMKISWNAIRQVYSEPLFTIPKILKTLGTSRKKFSSKPTMASQASKTIPLFPLGSTELLSTIALIGAERRSHFLKKVLAFIISVMKKKAPKICLSDKKYHLKYLQPSVTCRRSTAVSYTHLRAHETDS